MLETPNTMSGKDVTPRGITDCDCASAVNADARSPAGKNDGSRLWPGPVVLGHREGIRQIQMVLVGAAGGLIL